MKFYAVTLVMSEKDLAVREFAEDTGIEPRLVDRLAVFRPYL